MSRLLRNTLLIAASAAALGGLAATGAARGTSDAEPSAERETAGLAASMYLRLDGIEGESTSDRYKGQIEVQAFSFGVTGAGGRTTTGTVTTTATMQGLSITKRVDKSSPLLFQFAASGRVIPQGVLTIVSAGAEQQEVARLKLGQIVVSAYQTGGGSASDATDSFSLTFGTIDYEYVPLDPAGKPGVPVTARWDVKTGVKM